jgi:hypothetical protein
MDERRRNLSISLALFDAMLLRSFIVEELFPKRINTVTVA